MKTLSAPIKLIEAIDRGLIEEGGEVFVKVKLDCFIRDEEGDVTGVTTTNEAGASIRFALSKRIHLEEEWHKVCTLQELENVVGNLPCRTKIQFAQSEYHHTITSINWDILFSRPDPSVIFKVVTE